MTLDTLKTLLLTQQAQQVILAGAEGARETSIEFGGSLLASEVEGQPTLIAYAVPTGPFADQGPAHIRTDADYQNRAIQAVASTFSSLTYVGDWHIHPMYMPRLSGTDLATARSMLIEEHTHREHLLLMLCTLGPDGPELLGFEVSCPDGGRPIVQNLEIIVVENDASIVQARLEVPLSGLDDLLGELAKNTQVKNEFTPQDRPDRIAADLHELETECELSTDLLRDGDFVGAEVRSGRQRALVLFPPEYPEGAPLVFAGGLTGHTQQSTAI